MHERAEPEVRFAAAFAGLSAGSAALAALAAREGSGAAALWAWSTLSFAVVAVGYARGDASVLGKRRDGSSSPLSRLLLAPYRTLAWLIWRALKLGPENAHDEVAPGLFLGRRPTKGELPEGIALVVDLTAELATDVREQVPAYECLATLDGASPPPGAFAELVGRIAAHDGRVYVHCAAGHGRSAAVVAAVLLARGLATDLDGATRLLRAKRPGVRMTRSQRAAVAACASALARDRRPVS